LSLIAFQSSPFTIRAPAKLNLRLKVTGERPDGYHDLISVMIPIDLCDVLRLKLTSQNQVRLSCEGFSVPTDKENLACRAAFSFFTHTGIQKGLTIKLTKNIPVAAGLGGGSSDAAAALFVINEICGRPLSLSELHALAVELGADVPFFLESKPSLATGIGEILEPLEKWPKFWYVIVKPPLQVSTSWAYRNLKLELTRGEYDFIVKTLKSDPFRVSDLLNNDLERVTAARFPIIESIKIRLMEAGAEGALMSGSGPSVFGVFSSLDQAEKARKSLISQNLGDVFVVTDWKRPQPSES
jgi:4-diphosphocytidyl-2-C-methyl-D-erythritol kinase